jgi:hypothetical protein
VLFVDNNIGGNLPCWRVLRGHAPLRIRFGASITNCLLGEDIVKALARADAACCSLTESFNPAAIADMRKHQNLLDSIRFAWTSAGVTASS